MKVRNASVLRWYLSLLPFSFSVHHRPGSQHGDADYLSQWHTQKNTPKKGGKYGRTRNPHTTVTLLTPPPRHWHGCQTMGQDSLRIATATVPPQQARDQHLHRTLLLGHPQSNPDTPCSGQEGPQPPWQSRGWVSPPSVPRSLPHTGRWYAPNGGPSTEQSGRKAPNRSSNSHRPKEDARAREWGRRGST